MLTSLIVMIVAWIVFILLVLLIITLIKKAIELYTKKKYGKSHEQMEYERMNIEDL